MCAAIRVHDGFVGVTITDIIMMLSVESTPLKEEDILCSYGDSLRCYWMLVYVISDHQMGCVPLYPPRPQRAAS